MDIILEKINIRDSLSVLKGLGVNDPEAFLQVAHRGDMAHLKFPGNIYIVNNPHHASQFLLQDISKLNKSPHYEEFKVGLGNSLVIANGEDWKKSRRFLSSFFSPGQVKQYQTQIDQILTEEMEKWSQRENKSIDLWEDVLDITFKIIGNIIFGYSLEEIAPQAKKAFEDLSQLSIERMFMAFKPPRWVPIKNHREMKKCLKVISQISQSLIYDKSHPPRNLLKTIVDNVGERGIADSKKYIRDESITFLAAGYETMASGIFWSLYLLAKNDSILKKVQKEICEDEDPKWTRATIEEALRLYPPAPLVSRSPISNGDFMGITLKKKDIIMIPLYAIHRNPKYWENPNRFDPERFLRTEEKNPAYMPYIKGPRKCIGEHLSNLTMERFYKIFFNKFNINLEESIIPETKSKLFITLKPEKKIIFKLIRR